MDLRQCPPCRRRRWGGGPRNAVEGPSALCPSTMLRMVPLPTRFARREERVSTYTLNCANCGSAGLPASQESRSSTQISLVGGQLSGSSSEAVVTSNRPGRFSRR